MWNFEEATGVLTISGTGVVRNFVYAGATCPWVDVAQKVTDLVVEEVTRL